MTDGSINTTQEFRKKSLLGKTDDKFHMEILRVGGVWVTSGGNVLKKLLHAYLELRREES